MTRLLASMQRGELINASASAEMLAILQSVSWLNGLNMSGLSYSIPQAKVGHALQLLSEGGIARRGSSHYAFSWQNLNDALSPVPVYRIIDEVIKNW